MSTLAIYSLSLVGSIISVVVLHNYIQQLFHPEVKLSLSQLELNQQKLKSFYILHHILF